MLKNKFLNPYHLILLLLISILMSSCDAQKTLYSREGETDLNITLAYPENWMWNYSEDKITDAIRHTQIITDKPDPSKLNWENIVIFVYKGNDFASSYVGVLAYVRSEPASYYKVISDQEVMIGGHPAVLIISETLPRPMYGQDFYLYNEDYFVLLSDRYYSISLTIPKDQINSQYAKDFHDLIQNITFLP